MSWIVYSFMKKEKSYDSKEEREHFELHEKMESIDWDIAIKCSWCHEQVVDSEMGY